MAIRGGMKWVVISVLLTIGAIGLAMVAGFLPSSLRACFGMLALSLFDLLLPLFQGIHGDLW